jgi:predicted  nucleic acid-binding Zn-ribbon protein
MQKPLTLAQLILGLTITVIGGAATAGAAWSSLNSQVLNVSTKQTAYEESYKQLNERTSRMEIQMGRMEERQKNVEEQVRDMRGEVGKIAERLGVR